MSLEAKKERINFGRRQNCLDLEKYGIDPDSVGGAFYSEAKILAAQKRAPEFHIVSVVWLGLVYVANRFVSGWDSYHLADGNPDPSLEDSFPPLNHADVDEMEKEMRARGGGLIDPMDRGLIAILRGMLSGHLSLDGIVDRKHQREVRAEERARAMRGRGE